MGLTSGEGIGRFVKSARSRGVYSVSKFVLASPKRVSHSVITSNENQEKNKLWWLGWVGTWSLVE